MAFKLLIAAGGTGGHLMPALAVVRAIKERAPDTSILFVGTGRPLEGEILDPENWPRTVLNVSGIKGRNLFSRFKAIFKAVTALTRSIKIIRKFKPDFCFGLGGYVSGPVCLAAFFLGVKVIIHEQNSRPGLTNRWLAKISRVIFLGFIESEKFFPSKKTIFVGNPVRKEIKEIWLQKKTFGTDKFVLLVIGGSQGANTLNKLAVEVCRRLFQEGRKFKVIHQTGKLDESDVRESYRSMGVEFEVSSFIYDIDRVYQEAHLGIMRAGALTVTELAVAKLPAILVPLPSAADDHQTYNAKILADVGAAKLIKQNEISKVLEEVRNFIDDPKLLFNMSFSASNKAILDADQKMADKILDMYKA